MIRFLVSTVVTSFVLASSTSFAQPPAGSRAALEAELEAIALEGGGTLGVKVVHIESGSAAGLHELERFPMASVYKVPIAAVVLSRVDAGELQLDQEVEVRPGELRRTGSDVDPWTPGSRVPLVQLVDAMLTVSDNTACDVLLRLLGGPRVVDAWLDAHGYPDIDVSWTELTMAAVEAGVEKLPKDGECDYACLDRLVGAVPRERRAAAGRAFALEARNAAPPAEVARLLAALWKGKLLSARSTEALLSMMRRNRTGDRRIRALLPGGTPVWDKTGSIGRSANDAGVVKLPGEKGTLVVVAFVKGSEKGWEDRDRAIAKAARAAFDAFSR